MDDLVPTLDGYLSAGWQIEPDMDYVDMVTVDGSDVVLHATWVPVEPMEG